MGDTTRYTGDGRYTGGGRKNNWPHPNNDQFNQVIKNAYKIYGIGPKDQKDLLLRCKNYLHSRIQGIIEHKVVRESEEYYQAMNLTIDHGHGKDSHEQQNLIQNTSLVMCVGDWEDDEECLQQYRMANMMGKTIYELNHDEAVPFEKLVRYLEPVRKIEASRWDPNKQDDLLLFDNGEELEVIDGNHRHEFASRVGGVETVSAWIIKQV